MNKVCKQGLPKQFTGTANMPELRRAWE